MSNAIPMPSKNGEQVWLSFSEALRRNSAWFAGGQEHADCRKGTAECEARWCRESRRAVLVVEANHNMLAKLGASLGVEWRKGAEREDQLVDGPYAIEDHNGKTLRLGGFVEAMRWVRVELERRQVESATCTTSQAAHSCGKRL